MVLSWQWCVQVMQRTRVVAASGVLSDKKMVLFPPAAATAVCQVLSGMAGGCERHRVSLSKVGFDSCCLEQIECERRRVSLSKVGFDSCCLEQIE
jgi:hypothetical protein